MITHILMTRFNVRTNEGDLSTERLSPSWLRERLDLFNKYCFPSITYQTILPDVWIVMFNAQTPDEIKRLIENSIKGIKFIVPVYVDYFDVGIAKKLVTKYLPHGANWLITTRLDNDDALHPHFLEVVRSHAREGQREFINIPTGLVVANKRCYRKNDWSSPFISLSETAHEPTTVWIDKHHLLSRHGAIRQLNLRDGWIQIIHGGNLANQVRGVRVPFASINLRTLPTLLANSIERESVVDLLFDNSLGLFRRYTGSAFRFARTKLRDWHDTRCKHN